MRGLALFLILLVSACAASLQATDNSPELMISLSRDDTTLVSVIKNSSDGPICISSDVLQNEHTREVTVELRQGQRILKEIDRGYIPEPLRDYVRLEPGVGIVARYPLNSGRFPP